MTIFKIDNQNFIVVCKSEFQFNKPMSHFDFQGHIGYIFKWALHNQI
jgi:hypothetical protein